MRVIRHHKTLSLLILRQIIPTDIPTASPQMSRDRRLKIRETLIRAIPFFWANLFCESLQRKVVAEEKENFYFQHQSTRNSLLG